MYRLIRKNPSGTHETVAGQYQTEAEARIAAEAFTHSLGRESMLVVRQANGDSIDRIVAEYMQTSRGESPA